jgi:cell division protein FtsQ
MSRRRSTALVLVDEDAKPRRIGRWLTAGVLSLALAIGLATFAGDEPSPAFVKLSSQMGLDVQQVQINGLKNTSRLEVYSAVMAENTTAILSMDLDAIRDRVEAISWVDRASVARRLPGVIEVSVIERRPFAYVQSNRGLSLVDAKGVELERRNVRRFGALPVVAGDDALGELPKLVAMLDRTPDLRQQFAGAAWVGVGRWDVLFRSGEVLSLPEGEPAQEALRTFASLDRERQLLGQGFARFDMRLPDKLIVRKAEQPARYQAPLSSAKETQI